MNKKTELIMKTLYHMGMYFDNRYSKKYIDSDDYYGNQNHGVYSEYYLGNTLLMSH